MKHTPIYESDMPSNPIRLVAIIFVAIAIAFTLAVLTGCNSTERAERKMAKLLKKHPELLKSDSTTKVVVHTITIPHDTVLYIPGQETTIHDTLPCPTAHYIKSIKKNGLTASVSVIHGQLTVDCKADSLIKIISWKNFVIDSLITNRVVQKITVPAPEDRNWWWWLKTFVTGAVLLYFGFKYLGPVIMTLLRKIPNFPFLIIDLILIFLI